MTKQELKNRMISNAISTNKHLDKRKFENKTFRQILPYCHPEDRNEFAREIIKLTI